MKIVVTGATGFVGTHLIHHLLEQNHEVVASSHDLRKAERASWYSKVHYVPYSLHSAPTDENLFRRFDSPDALIHLAWQGLPNYNSLHHIEENVLSNYFFLKNFVRNGLKNLTVTGTCLEYGMQSGKLSEGMESRPSTAYAVGKYTLYRFLEILKNEIGFSLKWIRLFYLFGEGQASQSLLPQLERALAAGDESFPMSGGEQKRDFLPIKKASLYISKIAEQTKQEGIINCCSGNPVSVKDFIHDYLQSKNKSIELNLGHYPYPAYEPMEFWGDNSKLLEIITTNHERTVSTDR